jgi:hypothetical protein
LLRFRFCCLLRHLLTEVVQFSFAFGNSLLSFLPQLCVLTRLDEFGLALLVGTLVKLLQLILKNIIESLLVFASLAN